MLRHQVPVEPDRLPTLDRLLGLVAGWRSTQLFVDGVEVRSEHFQRLLRVLGRGTRAEAELEMRERARRRDQAV